MTKRVCLPCPPMTRLAALAVLIAVLWPSAGSRAFSAQPARCRVINAASDVAPQGVPTLNTAKEGYDCLLAHYILGKKLDDRTLLRGAYKLMTTALRNNGVTIPSSIVEPSYSEVPAGDWQEFAQVYRRIGALIPHNLLIPGALAELTLYGMTDSLHDDHTGYLPADFLHSEINELFDSGPVPSLGFVTSPITGTTQLFVTDVFTGTPAAKAGVRPGDVITLVDGQKPSSSAQLIFPKLGTSVSLVVHRPATGATLSFTLLPRAMKSPDVTIRIIAHSFYYVKLYGFTKNAAKEVLAKLRAMPAPNGITGFVLDLRGNGGGLIDGAVHLLSAFVHHKTLFVSVNGSGKRDRQGTDNSVPLLHIPIVVLTDGGSASSSEIVAGAVRDFHLGAVVGTRTAGALGGAEFFGLNDGSGLEITEARVLGAKGEVIDGVGVAPTIVVSTTARDLSTGHDPTVDEGVRTLKRLTKAS